MNETLNKYYQHGKTRITVKPGEQLVSYNRTALVFVYLVNKEANTILEFSSGPTKEYQLSAYPEVKGYPVLVDNLYAPVPKRIDKGTAYVLTDGGLVRYTEPREVVYLSDEEFTLVNNYFSAQNTRALFNDRKVTL